MENKVFAVSGDKFKSLLLTHESLMFSGKLFDSVDEFTEAWNKKLSLTTKSEIKYEKIKSIVKEDTSQTISIKYNAVAGLPSNFEFTFTDAGDYEAFFAFLEREQHFSKSIETLTPFKAASSYILGLLITIVITVFAYYQALDMAHGEDVNPRRGKAKLFVGLIRLLGDKGVLAVGLLISGFICYKIWTRFKNPPGVVKFARIS